MADDRIVSSYTQYLPAVLQEDPLSGRLLLAFEKILAGFPVAVPGDPLPSSWRQDRTVTKPHDPCQRKTPSRAGKNR